MSTDPLGPLLTQGVLGIVCVLLLLLGRIVFSKVEEAHARELKAKDEQHQQALEAIGESHKREIAAKDAQIASLGADKAAQGAQLADQQKFFEAAVVPGMTRLTDITREYVELIADQSRRALGSGR